MKNLSIAETMHTPFMKFDVESGLFEIKGRSTTQSAAPFYAPVFDWLSAFQPGKAMEITVKIYLTYFNTESTKCLYDLLIKFDEIYKKGTKMKIVWIYEEGDEDLKYDGESMSKRVSVPFELLEVVDEE